jgi:hypothetical protein
MSDEKTNPMPFQGVPPYIAQRTTSAPIIDGRLDEPCWRAAARSPRFADLVHAAPGRYDTRAAALWDDDFLYVGYWIEEPNVEARHTQRDALIYEDNDVELFIAGPDAYYELEVNALGTIYEVFFVWEEAYERAGFSRRPEFVRDAPGARPFDGVDYRHPRGGRIGFWNWDMPGLRWAVHVDGTLNDASDVDHGWSVEIAVPWSSLAPLAGDNALPPRDGDVWAMDFSRFNTHKAPAPTLDSGGWAWSPHGVWDSHVPERFTRVTFSTRPL